MYVGEVASEELRLSLFDDELALSFLIPCASVIAVLVVAEPAVGVEDDMVLCGIIVLFVQNFSGHLVVFHFFVLHDFPCSDEVVHGQSAGLDTSSTVRIIVVVVATGGQCEATDY